MPNSKVALLLLPKYLVILNEASISTFTTVRQSLIEIQLLSLLTLKYTTELRAFPSIIENQVIRGRTRLCVSSCDIDLIGIFFK